MTRNRATEYDCARQEFLALYPNRTQAILRPPGCKTWVSVSKHWPLPDEQIERAIALEETDTVWGCRWGSSTRFAVIDIDAGSKYHNVQNLQTLLAVLAKAGLTATPYQSSDSAGWHIYLFFDAWQNSSDVQSALKSWLSANGYEIRNGVLEVFPSGNGLRFPLQSGFGWLAPDAEVKALRDSMTTEQALSLFLTDLYERASDWQVCKTLIESQLNLAACIHENALDHQKAIDTEGFDGLWNYRLIPGKYQAGRHYWQGGLTEKGQRHEAILAVEHYLWHGDPEQGVPALPGEWNDDGRSRLLLAWLKEKHNGMCNHINRGNWSKVEAQIRRAVKWRRPSPRLQVVTPYPMTDRLIERLIQLSRGTGRIWSVEDLKKGNEGREQNARAKISTALATLLRQGSRITRNELARRSGCSPNTVSRHRDLWFLLACGSGDLNPLFSLDPSLSSSSAERDLLLAPFPVSHQQAVLDQSLRSSEPVPAEASPPLPSCLAVEPTTCTQAQDHALRVPSEVLRLGPVLRGIQAEPQELAGGSFFLSPLLFGVTEFWRSNNAVGQDYPRGKRNAFSRGKEMPVSPALRSRRPRAYGSRAPP